MVLGPLLGASVGVYLGFRKNRKHQEEKDYDKKLFLLSYLRHEVRKSIELLHEPHGYLIPIDAWNSIVNSGNIVLFTHDQAIILGDIYFKIKNYNYEAKRTRDAREHFALLPEPYEVSAYPAFNQVATQDKEKYNKAKERWETLSKGLMVVTGSLEKQLQELETINWFKEVQVVS
jgi:hypothetical protein